MALKLASSLDGNVTTAFSYGGQGKRLDSLVTTVQVQGTAQVFPQSFSYDIYGNRTSGNTSHATWTQTYHAASNLPNQLNYNSTALGTKAVASTPWSSYDPSGWMLKSINYGNGAASTFAYGADQSRLAEVMHLDSQMVIQADWAYTYDAVGNLTREYDKTKPDGGGSYAFDQYNFDELNRLVSAVIQSTTFGEQLQQFDYDAFGNRVSSNIQRITGWSGAKGASTAYVTASNVTSTINMSLNASDAALTQRNQIPAATSTGVLTGATYDPQGNGYLTQIWQKPGDASTAVNMTYDALGRVTSLGRAGAIAERYQYSAEGLRILVEEWQGSTLTKRRYNLYNDARQLVSQYDEALNGGIISSGAMQSLAATSTKTKTSSKVMVASVGINPVITSGNGTTLRWNVSNAVGNVNVSITGVGSVSPSSTVWVVPSGTSTYTLTATNTLDASKTVSADVTVTVVQKPVISFSANTTVINVGSSAILTWACTNGPTGVSIDNGVGTVGASGSTTVTPLVTTTYTINASNLGGSATPQTVTINVTQKPVIVSFVASPTSITKGRSSTLTWSTQGATTTTLNGQALSGSNAIVAPSTTQTYTLVVTNSAGSNQAQVTVTVTDSGTLTWKRDIVYLGTREAAEIDAAGMHVTQVDHLGSPRVVTGPTGRVESTQKYLPYGELLEQSGTYTTAKGYTNHEQTDPSGLIYMQARFYLPTYGRFNAPDPARDQHFEDTQSWNIYSYVRNSPIGSTDPTGMEEKISVPNQKSADNDETGMRRAMEEAAKKAEERKRAQTGKKQGWFADLLSGNFSFKSLLSDLLGGPTTSTAQQETRGVTDGGIESDRTAAAVSGGNSAGEKKALSTASEAVKTYGPLVLPGGQASKAVGLANLAADALTAAKEKDPKKAGAVALEVGKRTLLRHAPGSAKTIGGAVDSAAGKAKTGATLVTDLQ